MIGGIGNGGIQFSKHILEIYIREVNDAVITVPTGKLYVDEDKTLMIQEVSIFMLTPTLDLIFLKLRVCNSRQRGNCIF